jgi:hypothetical protein
MKLYIYYDLINMDKKVALCFIISYEHILHKEQLWIDWIKPNKDIINVYFHYKDINKITSPWIKMYTIPPHATQKTSYLDVVPAYLAVMMYAYNNDINNLWFCFVTDTCVPIISPSKFRKLFFDHYQASIMKWRLPYWNINIHKRANLRLLSEEYRLANDPWFVLSRDHVQKCLLFISAKPKIYKLVNDGGYGNESIFAIILKTFNELNNENKLINEVSTIADWTKMSNPNSPHFFKEASNENINIILKLLKENKYCMFLRKVHNDFSENELKKIIYDENNIHDYDILHNSAKKRHKPIIISLRKLFRIMSFCLVGYFFLTIFFTEMFVN